MSARVTRRQARTWLAPMRECFGQMRTGFAPAANGFPVTRLHDGDDWVRIDYCISGFVGMIGRLSPGLSTAAMRRIQSKIEAGELVTTQEIDAALSEIRRAEDVLVKLTVKELASAVTTEQIAIEMEAVMREAA
ncbi:hypothetical protein [Niveibacterium terrae]|uniref:hypothetical protein n=1 Tax=Niveibacterium terrae TaxID=3373598 RepID=UPI003A955D55